MYRVRTENRYCTEVYVHFSTILALLPVHAFCPVMSALQTTSLFVVVYALTLAKLSGDLVISSSIVAHQNVVM